MGYGSSQKGDQTQEADNEKPQRNWFGIIMTIFGAGVIVLVAILSIIASSQNLVK